MSVRLLHHAGDQRTGAPTEPVADVVMPLVNALLGDDLPVSFEFWDGSGHTASPSIGTMRLVRPEALRRVLWAPGELGLGRAYVAGDIEFDGDVFALITALGSTTPPSPARAAALALDACRRLGLLGLPPSPPPEEVRLHGLRHSLRRDARAISHHYDVGNDFYRLVLGPTLTYSCARFVDDGMGLDEAQTAKHDLVCRKLGLHRKPDARLLDVGCGWGSMVMHAAGTYGTRAVGITISTEQAALARERVRAAGLDALVEIREQDYREIGGEQFDAISSIGMSEHVGAKHLDEYFGILRRSLVPTGRLLNHAISSVGGSRMSSRSFVGRYVFPDGELIDLGQAILAMERAGFEVRDVESLREHYARTLRAWVANLDAGWERAVELVGESRARVWRLYMTGSAVGFEDGGIGIHQTLGVVPTKDGTSAMPPTRDWD